MFYEQILLLEYTIYFSVHIIYQKNKAQKSCTASACASKCITNVKHQPYLPESGDPKHHKLVESNSS